MKALVVTSIGDPQLGTYGTLDLVDLPVPEVGPEDVLIKVSYASICGSDTNVLRGNLGPLRERILAQLPRPLGHEICGVVAALGTEAANLGLSVGDRVTANYTRYCNACHYCRTGQEAYCQYPTPLLNGVREYVAWHVSQVHRVPSDVEQLTAVLTEPMTIALNAVETAKVRPGASVAVFGAGGVGLLAIQLARLAGAGRVVALEPVASKHELAVAAGADLVIDPSQPGLLDAAAEITQRLGFDCVLETSGNSHAARQAIEVIGKGGHVVYLAMYDPAFNLPVNLFTALYQQGVHLDGMHTSSDLFPRAVQLLRRVNADAVISKVYPLEAYDEAFRQAASGELAKFVFAIDPTSSV